MPEGSFLKVFGSALHDYHASLSAERQQRLLETFQTSPEKIIGSALRGYSQALYNSLIAQIYPRTLDFRAEDAEFMAKQDAKWGHCFVLLDSYYNVNIECGDMYREAISKDEIESASKIPNKFDAVFALHARACQMFLEITCLCKNGFSDAAFSRWRSLYELSVIADRLSREDDSISYAYLNSYGKKDTQFRWLRESPNFSSYNTITFSKLHKESSFASALWESSYHLSNCTVHGSADGTLARIAMPEGICSGKSDYGIEIPATHASTSLLQISSVLLTLVYTYDSVAHLSLLTDFNKKIINDFERTAKQLTRD